MKDSGSFEIHYHHRLQNHWVFKNFIYMLNMHKAAKKKKWSVTDKLWEAGNKF